MSNGIKQILPAPLLGQLRKAKRLWGQTLGQKLGQTFGGSSEELQAWPQMPYPTANLTYWRYKGGVNFGDELSRTITELMLARRSTTMFDETSRARQLLVVGSVLHLANDDATVWGSGRNGHKPDEAHFFKRLDVRAVRGPRTQEFLSKRGIKVPSVFGDPALLLPTLLPTRYKAQPNLKKPVKIAFIPNLNDFGRLQGNLPGGMVLIDPRQSWNRVIAQLVQQDLIIASSLHGLVMADAYGIPCRYVRLTETEGLFKYLDYYEGIGVNTLTYARSLPEALEMGGAPVPQINVAPLMQAFPYDIWDI